MLAHGIGPKHNSKAGHKAVSEYLKNLKREKTADSEEAEEERRLKKEAAEIEKKIADLHRRIGR